MASPLPGFYLRSFPGGGSDLRETRLLVASQLSAHGSYNDDRKKQGVEKFAEVVIGS